MTFAMFSCVIRHDCSLFLVSVVFQHGVEDLVGLLEKSRPLLVRAQNAVFDQNVQEQCSKRADEECDDGEQFLTYFVGWYSIPREFQRIHVRCIGR